jgi:hypothetical protein
MQIDKFLITKKTFFWGGGGKEFCFLTDSIMMINVIIMFLYAYTITMYDQT